MAVENLSISAPGLSASEITQRLNGLIEQLESQFGGYISDPRKQIDFTKNEGLIQANILGHELATSFAAGDGIANFNVSVPDTVMSFIRNSAMKKVKDTLSTILSR